MFDLEVRIDGNLAMVWTPCRICLDGKVFSKAGNCITLHKEDGTWKIITIADTATKTVA